jgi:hypothetical protein
MSIRSWQAAPSQQIELDGRVWPVVSQDDLIKAVVDGAILLDRAGGCLQVVLQRQPTPLPNEMVTVAAVVVWQDRTNAKPQPEDRGLEVVEGESSNGHVEQAPEVDVGAEGPDALDAEPVDESAVPAELRG